MRVTTRKGAEMNLNDRTINALQHRVESYQQLETSIMPYTINWASVLQADTISTSTWSAPSMTISTPTNTTSTATAKLTASPGRYTATNTITTAAGNKDQRSINIHVQRVPDNSLAGDYD